MNSSQREILTTGATAMGVALDEASVTRFAIYLSLLQQWGRKVNLTSRLETDEVIAHHFLDSLAGAAVIAASRKVRVVDLGTGAGLPSLPLKFAFPQIQLLLVESVRKKVAFCQEVVRKTELTGVEVAWARAEEIAADGRHGGHFDWAVSRAVGPAAALAEIALPFLATGGRILLYKGNPGEDELRGLERFCAAHGAVSDLQRIVVPHLAGVRSLFTISFPGHIRES